MLLLIHAGFDVFEKFPLSLARKRRENIAIGLHEVHRGLN
jgi:hypothetical protein